MTTGAMKRARAACAALMLSACSQGSGEQPATFSVSDSAGAMWLSQAPNEIAMRPDDATRLTVAFEIGGASTDLGYIADVDFADDGSVWVLDRMNARVVRFSDEGSQTAAFGRPGEGPGEFSQPWVLVTSGPNLIVMDRVPHRGFALFDTTGAFLSSRPFDGGDWFALQFREPDDRFEPGAVNPPGDVTRRLAGTGNGGFILQTQVDELRAYRRGVDPLTIERGLWLIRYEPNGTVSDTIATLEPPPLRFESHHAASAFPIYTEGHFASRPLWAVGRGWLATIDRDSTAILIQPLSSPIEPTEIRWHPAALPLDEVQRRAYWQSFLERQMQHGSASEREWLESESRSELRRTIDRAASEMIAPTTRPELMALYGAGQCVWVSGFDATDHHSGVALTLAAIGIRSRQIEWHVRIPRRGSRLRAVAPHAIATSYVDADGLVRVEVYRLPDRRCDA